MHEFCRTLLVATSGFGIKCNRHPNMLSKYGCLVACHVLFCHNFVPEVWHVISFVASNQLATSEAIFGKKLCVRHVRFSATKVWQVTSVVKNQALT